MNTYTYATRCRQFVGETCCRAQSAAPGEGSAFTSRGGTTSTGLSRTLLNQVMEALDGADFTVVVPFDIAWAAQSRPDPRDRAPGSIPEQVAGAKPAPLRLNAADYARMTASAMERLFGGASWTVAYVRLVLKFYPNGGDGGSAGSSCVKPVCPVGPRPTLRQFKRFTRKLERLLAQTPSHCGRQAALAPAYGRRAASGRTPATVLNRMPAEMFRRERTAFSNAARGMSEFSAAGLN